MNLAYEITVDGDPFDDWSRVSVSRGGVNVSVTIQSVDPYWTCLLYTSPSPRD